VVVAVVVAVAAAAAVVVVPTSLSMSGVEKMLVALFLITEGFWNFLLVSPCLVSVTYAFMI
jgi:hypothetical protein